MLLCSFHNKIKSAKNRVSVICRTILYHMYYIQYLLLFFLGVHLSSCSHNLLLHESKLSTIIMQENGKQANNVSINLKSIRLWSIPSDESPRVLADNNGRNYYHLLLTLELKNKTSASLFLNYEYSCVWCGPIYLTVKNAHTQKLLPEESCPIGGNCQQKTARIMPKKSFQLNHLSFARKIENLNTPLIVYINGNICINGEKYAYALSDTFVPCQILLE